MNFSHAPRSSQPFDMSSATASVFGACRAESAARVEFYSFTLRSERLFGQAPRKRNCNRHRLIIERIDALFYSFAPLLAKRFSANQNAMRRLAAPFQLPQLVWAIRGVLPVALNQPLLCAICNAYADPLLYLPQRFLVGLQPAILSPTLRDFVGCHR